MRQIFSRLLECRVTGRFLSTAASLDRSASQHLAGCCSSSSSKRLCAQPPFLHPALLHPGRFAHRHLALQTAAKKKKQGGGGQKKGPGSVIDIPKSDGPVAETQAKPSKQPWEETDVVMINLLLIENYRRSVGRPIMEGGDILQLAKDLFEAPFALLFHDRFVSEEPKFLYANQAALDLFQTSWQELLGTPSKESAPQNHQEVRQALLDEVADKGFVQFHSGRRRGLQGREFDIVDAILFNVEGPDGNKVGQATVMRHWRFDDGTAGGPDAPEPAVSEGLLQEAEGYAAEQGNLIRELKEGRGLANSDPEVQAAVEELLRRKQAAERIRTTLANGSPSLETPAVRVDA